MCFRKKGKQRLDSEVIESFKKHKAESHEEFFKRAKKESEEWRERFDDLTKNWEA